MHDRRHPKPLTMNTSPIKPCDSLKHSQLMEKLKDYVLNLANSNPNNPLKPSQIALIEDGLLHAFSSFDIPTHPPYSAMIEEAIKKLDSEGSLTTENIISEYIIETYEGLPWAHNRYLKHHLGQLCESGELDCDIDGSYITPGQKNPRSSRRQVLKRKLLGKKKEDTFQDGNLGGDELNELSDSQVGCQEEASQGLGRGKRKRRRSFVFDDEEEDEVVETMVAVREGNMDSGSEMVVMETQNEVLLVKGGEVDFKSNETEYLDHGHEGISEGKYELQSGIERAKEVNNQVVQVDCEFFGGTKEPQSVLPENVMKILPVRSEGEATKLDGYGANMMEIPVKNVNESNLVGDQNQDFSGGLMLVSVDASGSTVEKCVLKERTPNPSARDLMIVPYVDNQVNPAIRKEMIPLLKSIDPIIVCGLTSISEGLPKPKKKPVYQHRRRSNSPQDKAKALTEEPMLASLISAVQTSLETKVKPKSQSPKSKEVTLLEDSSFKQLQSWRSSHPRSHENISNVRDSTLIKLKRKSQSPKSKGSTPLGDGSVKRLQGQKSSHTINPENISIEGEEPLCQVMEKRFDLKRHWMQGAKLKVASPLASSIVGAQSPEELPGLENFAEMTPRAEKESALIKRTQKHLHMELGTQDRSQHDVQHQREDSDGQSQKKLRHHVPELPVEAFMNEKMLVVDQLPRKQNKVDQESPVKLIDATPENENEKQLCWQLRSQDKSQHDVEHQREESDGRGQQEDRFDALEQLGVAPLNGKLLVFDQRPQNQNKVDQESPLKLTEATLENKASLSEMQNQVPDHHQHQPQLENRRPKKRRRGRPPNSEKATKTKQMLSLEHVSDSSNLQLQNSQKKEKSVKQDGQVRTRKQRASEKDEADLLEPNLKEQEQLPGTERSRNKPSGKARRGKTVEVKEKIVAMDLFSMRRKEEQGNLDPQYKHLNTDETIAMNLPQQQWQSEPTTRNCGRPPKIKNEVTEAQLAASLILDNQQEVGLSEQVNNQESQNKKMKRGRPRIQKEGDKDDDHDFGTLEKGETNSGVGPSNLQYLKQGGLKSASHAILEASSRQSQVDLTESLPTTSDINRQRDTDQCQPRRRITRSSEAAKTLLQSQNGKQQDVELSGPRRLAKPTPVLVPLDHHCPDKESEDSENEYQVRSQQHKDQEQVKSYERDHAREKMEVQARESRPETSGQISHPDLGLSAMKTSDASTCLGDKSCQRHKDQNQPRRMSTRSSEAAKTFLESQNGKQHRLELSGQRRPAKVKLTVVPSDHNCLDKSEHSNIEDLGKPVDIEQPEESHDCDQIVKKMGGEVNLPKKMSARNVSVQVPLSSKDKLRSRMKRQSQDA